MDLEKKLDFVPEVRQVSGRWLLDTRAAKQAARGRHSVSVIQRAWRRMLLIVLMPDSVMGHTAKPVEEEEALLPRKQEVRREQLR